MPGHTLTLRPSGRSQTFSEGTILADALADMGVMVKTPCGGKGTCGKCRVRASGGTSGPAGTCLSCQARLAGDVQVYLDELPQTGGRTYPVPDPAARYAVAVDIGTTTVKVSLVDCTHDRSWDLDVFLNPQRRWGHDVISRIAASADREVFSRMTFQIRHSVFSSIRTAFDAMNLSPGRIEKIVVAGNTTMLYLFLGLDVEPLGRFPFPAATRDFDELPANQAGADQFGSAVLSALPVHSAFLGADLVGGLALCHGLGFTRGVFFIDLGTNGEIFLLDGEGEVYATSCAMGPALEGMNISWGMTADSGAISRISLEGGKLGYSMIGEGEPAGITGTALIDIVAIMLGENIIRTDGAFARGLEERVLPHPMRYVLSEDTAAIRLWGDITLTQKDIRNVQLAKGAALAAGRLLLKEAACPADRVDHVLIAGAFGEHLEMQHFRTLGFLPDFPGAAWHFLGNTSLKAAQKACCNGRFSAEAAALRNRIHEVSLSQHPEFATEFIAGVNFGQGRDSQ